MCAAFPGGMRNAMRQAAELPEHVLRNAGIVSAVLGVLLLWLIKAA